MYLEEQNKRVLLEEEIKRLQRDMDITDDALIDSIRMNENLMATNKELRNRLILSGDDIGDLK